MASITCEWRKMGVLYCNCWECSRWRKKHRRKWKKLLRRVRREDIYRIARYHWQQERPSPLHLIQYIKWRLREPKRKEV